MDNLELFLKKTKKDFESQLQAYKKKLTTLANKEVDYAFLKSLIEEVSTGDDIEIVIEMSNATMTIRKEKEQTPNKPNWG